MRHLTQSTKPVSAKDVRQAWHLIDLKGVTLGRITPQIAKLLQGKHKVQYSPHIDTGDFVVVVNAAQVELTGKKVQTKTYTSYSGYPGGLKVRTFASLRLSQPAKIVKHAVSGMLPKNKLRDKRLARLFVFPDEKHPYRDKFKT